MTARGLIVSAPRSSSGKTTVTLGLLGALKRKGVAVRAAKSGPDYIDPAFHAAATAGKGVNLDTWAMPPALIDALIADAARDAELLVIEGAMGLFDGVPGTPGRSGAAADLAARFSLPVLLILDVSGQSQSAAAVAAGFAAFDPKVRLGGVVLNKLGSDRHRTLIADALAPRGIPVLGAIPRDETLMLPERHLGLVQASEHPDLAARLASFADMAARHLDLDAIAAMAAPLKGSPASASATLKPPGQRIALAYDAAFSFVYAHVLDGWRQRAARRSCRSRRSTTSRRRTRATSAGCRAAIRSCTRDSSRRPAGSAKALQASRRHGRCMASAAVTWCSGRGSRTPRACATRWQGFCRTRRALPSASCISAIARRGYSDDHPLGAAGDLVRGHEFHHATIIDKGNDDPFVEVTDAQGRPVDETGSRRGLVSGTFFHAIARES